MAFPNQNGDWLEDDATPWQQQAGSNKRAKLEHEQVATAETEQVATAKTEQVATMKTEAGSAAASSTSGSTGVWAPPVAVGIECLSDSYITVSALSCGLELAIHIYIYIYILCICYLVAWNWPSTYIYEYIIFISLSLNRIRIGTTKLRHRWRRITIMKPVSTLQLRTRSRQLKRRRGSPEAADSSRFQKGSLARTPSSMPTTPQVRRPAEQRQHRPDLPPARRRRLSRKEVKIYNNCNCVYEIYIYIYIAVGFGIGHPQPQWIIYIYIYIYIICSYLYIYIYIAARIGIGHPQLQWIIYIHNICDCEDYMSALKYFEILVLACKVTELS